MDRYFCPKCKNEATDNKASLFTLIERGLSIQTISIWYFNCPKCRLIYLDQQLMKANLSYWYRQRRNKKVHCFRKIYKEVSAWMRTIVEDWERRGYKKAKFKKVKANIPTT